MKNRNVFGLSRSRDKYGNVIKLSESDYVMCIHSRVSSGHDNMWVLIGEESMKKTEHMEKTKKPEGKGWMWSEEKNKWYRIRRLTPRDALRIMDVDSKYVDLLMGTIEKNGNSTRLISDSQLYKIAGNSIVVNCLHLIFKNMFCPGIEVVEKNVPIQLSLF